MQPQVTYRTDTTKPVPQPGGHRGDLFTGFVQPPPESHHRRPRRRTTADNMSRANAQAPRGSYEVSGAHRPHDTDSGYGSMPSNDRDVAQQPADVFFWDHVNSDPTMTTCSGEITLENHLHRDCFEYSFVDPSLYDGASSSNRGDSDGSQALLGLTLPGPAEPVDMWAFPNIDADLSEYSGN